jgi:hypothetical protein
MKRGWISMGKTETIEVEKTYLRKWKQELEEENKKSQHNLEKFKNLRIELHIKKSILLLVTLQSGNEESAEEFKVFTDYYLLVERLDELENQRQLEIEKRLSTTIQYNKTIIRSIDLNLS